MHDLRKVGLETAGNRIFLEWRDRLARASRRQADYAWTVLARMLSWGGCTEAEIATITGHSLRDVRTILDSNYLSRDPALGESAIRKLERGTKF
jgi:hypothetical protein